MKNAVFWDVAPCRSYVNRRFGGTYRLHLHGRKIVNRKFFYPEDGGDTFLRNVVSHKIYTAPHPRRRHSSSNILIPRPNRSIPLIPNPTILHDLIDIPSKFFFQDVLPTKFYMHSLSPPSYLVRLIVVVLDFAKPLSYLSCTIPNCPSTSS
jgi:hypothetical protein